MRRNTAGTILLLLCLNFASFGQPSDVQFKYVSFNEGLSNAYVRAITQDDNRYIWIGTDDGLNRYNGYEMTVYRHNPSDPSSIHHNSVSSLLKDKKGRLWVGTEAGIDLYDADMDSFIHVMESESGISALFESSDSTIWAGTARGIFIYSEKTGKFESADFKEESSERPFNADAFAVNIFREYDERYLIAGAWQGVILIIDRKRNSIRAVTGEASGVDINHISSIEIDGNKNIWIGSYGNGLFHFDIARNRIKKINISKKCDIDNRIMSIFNDQEGHIWIGTEQSGLYKLYINSYDIAGYEYEHFIDNEWPGSLSYRSVTCVYKDIDGGLWIGTHNGGVNYLSSEKRFFKSIRRNPFIDNTLSHKKVWGLCEDEQGNIWVGTDGGGLDVIDPKSDTIKNFSADGKPGSISDNAILCAYKDSAGDLWFGAYAGGLNLYLPNKNKFRIFKHDAEDTTTIGGNDVRAIIEDSRGRIWVGTNQGGLNLLNKATGKFKRYNTSNSNLGSNDIRALYIDSQERLWIGTFGSGLSLFNNGDFQNFRIKDTGVRDNIVFSIDEDSAGILWLGTYGSGLVRFDPENKSFDIFDEKKGLANNVVHALTIDGNNNIWLSSNKGISRFNIRSEEFYNYSTSDGLPTLAFNDGSVLKSDNGNFYFGSLDGLVYFNPGEDQAHGATPSVIVEDFKLFNESIKPDRSGKKSILRKAIGNTGKIVLNNNQSVFSFQYAAIHFPNPARVHYSYMLEGIDQRWNYVANLRNVTYTKLPSGDYIFKVRASLDNKTWSEATAIQVSILPPFWKTWWAYALYLLLVVFIFYATRRYRLNKIRMERKIEIEQLEKKKLSEIHNLKMNFFTNISHEFRTPLTLIISPLEQIIRDQNISGLLKNTLLSVYNHAHKLHHLINQLMEFRKMETGNINLKVTENDLMKFTYEIYFAFVELSKVNKVKYEFITDAENLRLWFNQKHFEMILYNLISNAFKYTPQHGKISVEIKANHEINPQHCEIHIRDNGKGISPEYVDLIFNRYYRAVEVDTAHITGSGIGLALVKDLVELHKGEIEVKSEKNKGTEVILKFKLGKDHFSQGQILEDHADSEHPQNYTLAADPAHNIGGFLQDGNGKIHKHSILVIEDNDDIRAYIKSLFARSFKILEANDGEEGYHLAKTKTPSVVISDIMMPGMDGIELCKNLKNDSSTSHIPVVLLTARADDLHKLEGISIGADDYITKPFNAEILKAKIDTLIRNLSKLHEYYTSRILLQPIEDGVDSADREFLDKAIELVEKNLLTPDFGLKNLMDELCVSQATLYRKIKQLTGESTSEFIRSVRIKRAAELIKLNKYSITQVAYDVGFSSARYFRDSFYKIYKMTPSEYAREFKIKAREAKQETTVENSKRE